MAAPMALGFTALVQPNLQLNAERLRHTEYAYYFMTTCVRIPPYNLKHKCKRSVVAYLDSLRHISSCNDKFPFTTVKGQLYVGLPVRLPMVSRTLLAVCRVPFLKSRFPLNLN